MPNQFFLLSIIFGGLGGAFILVAIVMLLLRRTKISGYIAGNGTVVDLHQRGPKHYPVVEFTPLGHAPVKFTSRVGANPPRFRKGEPVSILYSPTDPSKAFINTFWQLWFFPMLFGILGAPFLIVSGILLVLGN